MIRTRPIASPTGIASRLPSVQPIRTRRKLMPIYCISVPSISSSRPPFTVLHGPGMTSGPYTSAPVCQISSTAAHNKVTETHLRSIHFIVLFTSL
ncbi:hypothetical protein D3C76_1656500 [compost metagenome]